MINVGLEVFVKKYLTSTKTSESAFAKNCGTTLENLRKFLNGEHVKYTITRKYLWFLVNVIKEVRKPFQSPIKSAS